MSDKVGSEYGEGMKMNRTKINVVDVIFFSGMLLLSLFSIAVASEESNCLICHEQLTKGKSVHAAVQMGCPTCHPAIDAKDIPHKVTNKISKGLSAEVPDLCFTCHSKAEFSKKNTHMPVAGGMCLSCHRPHASDHPYLLVKGIYDVCLDCHAEVKKQPHVVAGLPGKGHPLGRTIKDAKTGEQKALMDPLRPDKPFYCASCHNPHASDNRRLLRFESASAFDICSHCHKK